MATRIMTAAVIRKPEDAATVSKIVQAEIERLKAEDAKSLAKLIAVQNERIARLENARNRLLAEKMPGTYKKPSRIKRAAKRLKTALDVAWAFVYAVPGDWMFGDLIGTRLKTFTLLTLMAGFTVIAGCMIYAALVT